MAKAKPEGDVVVAIVNLPQYGLNAGEECLASDIPEDELEGRLTMAHLARKGGETPPADDPPPADPPADPAKDETPPEETKDDKAKPTGSSNKSGSTGSGSGSL